MRIGITAVVGAVVVALFLVLYAGEALADHVRCGDTITRSTTLDSDLVCSGSLPGIRAGADAVTLDLNGHLVDHSGIGPGISNPGFDDVTLQNGAVHTPSSHGIFLSDAQRNTLRDLRVVRACCGNALP